MLPLGLSGLDPGDVEVCLKMGFSVERHMGMCTVLWRCMMLAGQLLMNFTDVKISEQCTIAKAVVHTGFRWFR